jgi:CO/xanthine dehydrogenase Mo-binding subunit
MVQSMPQQTQSGAVGTSIPRSDGLDKVTGRTRYAGDRAVRGMLFARLVTSPYAHARLLHIDTAAALSIPGVVAVFTGEMLGIDSNPLSRTQTLLAHQEVLWCGHPVAVVVGETAALAEDGATAVEVDYEPLPVVIDPASAALRDSPLTRSLDESQPIADAGEHGPMPPGGLPQAQQGQEESSPNVTRLPPMSIGDIEAGLREADIVVEYSYRTHPVHQSYLEPHSVMVEPEASGNHLQVWPSTQGLYMVRTAVAAALKMPERMITVEPVAIGGGFGGKEGLIEPLVAAVASRLRKPVQLIYTRQEDLLAGNPAPQTVISVKMGAKKDGTLTAIQANLVLDLGAYPNALAGLGGIHFLDIYRCPNIDIHTLLVQTNKTGTGPYRAPFGPQAYFAIESTVQELCQRLAMDPLVFRQLNALREGDPSMLMGRWPRIGLLACLEQIQQHPLWTQREQARQQVPEELKGWRIGTGLAAGGWPGGTEPAAALCRMETDGAFTVVVGSIDLSGSDTSLALIAAQELGMAADAVIVRHDNSDTMPYSGITAASKTIYTVGAAVQAAARDARAQILNTAADMLEASANDLELKEGRVIVRGVPEKYVTLQQIAASSMQFGAPYEPIFGRGRSANRVASPMFAAHVAKVAVDPETGEVRVLDYVAAQDVGLAINPAEVEGQIHGGVVQGIGWALCEGMFYDENGQLLNPTLMDYALPTSQDAPPITPLLVEVPSGLGPYGARGVGEPPVVPVAAAIANAINDAVGVHMTQIPMTPETVFTALKEKQ